MNTAKVIFNMFLIIQTCCIILCLINECRNVPIGSKYMSDAEVAAYMIRYNFMEDVYNDLDNPHAKVQDISKAVRAFQHRYNLNETGVLDPETRYWIQLPRCGMVDDTPVEDITKKRKRRYATHGSKWNTTTLTYNIIKYPDNLSRADTDNEIARAFRVWEDVSSLIFNRRTSGSANIEILFEAGEHGDGDPFDGPEYVLAHAFFPVYGGDAHFDNDELWTVNSYSGMNLFRTAAHEFGHSLGLQHSNVREAFMFPFTGGFDPNFRLHTDDIDGIQHLYGTNVPATGTTGLVPDFCGNAQFDAVTLHEIDGEPTTFVFQGEYYARLLRNVMLIGYPRRISDDWPGLEDNIDAALYWETEYKYRYGTDKRVGIKLQGRTYFFKGSRYWRYENMTLVDSYPRDISRNWIGLPSNLDAAFVWSGNHSTYFIKGDQIYRYRRESGVDSAYPRPLSLWNGLPASIDAAVQWLNSRTYFFSGTSFYRFNDRNFRVEAKRYPRENNYWWLGCRSQNVKQRDESSITISNGGSNDKSTSYMYIFTSLILYVFSKIMAAPCRK